MASGVQRFNGAFIGVAAEVNVAVVPFQPISIRFYVDGGSAMEHGFKHESMSGSDYLSTSTGTDAGVTINSDGFTVASGADINVATATVFYECEG